MGFASWILIGVMIGIGVSFLARARGLSRLSYIAVSVMGSLLGGINIAYLYQTPGAINGFNLKGMIVAAIGALLACTALGLFGHRKSQAAEGRL